MFCDNVDIKLGDVPVKVRRASLDELRDGGLAVLSFVFGAQKCLDPAVVKFVGDHCKTADDKPVEVGELSLPQMQALARAIGGVPDGVPMADFIALLL